VGGMCMFILFIDSTWISCILWLFCLLYAHVIILCYCSWTIQFSDIISSLLSICFHRIVVYYFIFIGFVFDKFWNHTKHNMLRITYIYIYISENFLFVKYNFYTIIYIVYRHYYIWVSLIRFENTLMIY